MTLLTSLAQILFHAFSSRRAQEATGVAGWLGGSSPGSQAPDALLHVELWCPFRSFLSAFLGGPLLVLLACFRCSLIFGASQQNKNTFFLFCCCWLAFFVGFCLAFLFDCWCMIVPLNNAMMEARDEAFRLNTILEFCIHTFIYALSPLHSLE